MQLAAPEGNEPTGFVVVSRERERERKKELNFIVLLLCGFIVSKCISLKLKAQPSTSLICILFMKV